MNAVTHGDKFLSHCNKFKRREIEQILLEYKLQEEQVKQSSLYTQCSTQQNMMMIQEQNTSSEYMIEEIKEEPPSYTDLCTPIFEEHNYSLYNTQVQDEEEREEYNIPLLQRIQNSTSVEENIPGIDVYTEEVSSFHNIHKDEADMVHDNYIKKSKSFIDETITTLLDTHDEMTVNYIHQIPQLPQHYDNMSDLVKSTVAETIHAFENTTKDILQYAENIVKNGQYYYQEERKRENINCVPKA